MYIAGLKCHDYYPNMTPTGNISSNSLSSTRVNLFYYTAKHFKINIIEAACFLTYFNHGL